MSNNPLDKHRGKPVNSVATVSKYFEQYKAQLTAALPKHLTADRMSRLALTALSQNKALAECDPKSLFGSVIIASQLGLEIGVLGQGYLVPYKGKATFIPGWQGLVDLVSRAGRATVWTGGVFEGDKFEFQLGDSPFIKHVPMGEDDPRLLTHVYSVGRVNGSPMPVIEVWPIKRVLKHRDKYNKVGLQHYSHNHWEMYARKVVLLQVIKYLPKSVELSNALKTEIAYEEGKEMVLDGEFMNLGDDIVEPEKEVVQETTTVALTAGDVMASLKNARNVDELNLAADLIREIGNPDQNQALKDLYEARLAELSK